ncbi:MAG TPA: formate/nitrite transporter family protein [Bryobacteraceae bacterium]|nr:formate/nitrite transporter family protein [Bryobacteraceae bacterium]
MPGEITADSEEAQKPEIQKEIEKHTNVRVQVVHAAVVRNGERELCRSTSALAWSGLAAGFSMGFSFIVEGILKASLPDTAWRPLVVFIGYSFGFLVVILARQQLFTENTLTAFLPLMSRRNTSTFRQVARLWAVVLLANLVGAHIVAWVLGNTPVLSREIQTALADLAREAAAVGFWPAVLRGIFAGWIIALLVWILAAMESHSVAVIVLLTWLVAAGKFTHIIAGSIEVLFLVMTGVMPWGAYLGGYMVPTLLGNVIGGVSLVSALNHAQVTSGEPGSKEDLED